MSSPLPEPVPPKVEPAGARPGPGRHLAWIPPILYMAAIFYLSSQAAPLPELTRVLWDKLLHATEYGGLGFLLALALRASGVSPARSWWLAVILTSAYGATDELHQAFVPGRDAEALDWLADTVGGVLGALAASIVLRVWRTRASIRAAGSGN